MEELKQVKLVETIKCPECEKEFYSCRSFFSQQMWALKKDDVQKIKDNLKKTVEKIKFKNEEEKKVVIDYLENNVIGAEDVDSLLESIIKNHT